MPVPRPAAARRREHRAARRAGGQGRRRHAVPRDRRLQAVLRRSRRRAASCSTSRPRAQPYVIDTSFRDPSGNNIRLARCSSSRGPPLTPAACGARTRSLSHVTPFDDRDHVDRSVPAAGTDVGCAGIRGHRSIHDTATAGAGLAGAPIEAPTHFSQFDPLAAPVWGHSWFEHRCIERSLHDDGGQGERCRPRSSSMVPSADTTPRRNPRGHGADRHCVARPGA